MHGFLCSIKSRRFKSDLQTQLSFSALLGKSCINIYWSVSASDHHFSCIAMAMQRKLNSSMTKYLISLPSRYHWHCTNVQYWKRWGVQLHRGGARRGTRLSWRVLEIIPLPHPVMDLLWCFVSCWLLESALGHVFFSFWFFFSFFPHCLHLRFYLPIMWLWLWWL